MDAAVGGGWGAEAGVAGVVGGLSAEADGLWRSAGIGAQERVSGARAGDGVVEDGAVEAGFVLAEGVEAQVSMALWWRSAERDVWSAGVGGGAVGGGGYGLCRLEMLS